jgi:hypothetical protein
MNHLPIAMTNVLLATIDSPTDAGRAGVRVFIGGTLVLLISMAIGSLTGSAI